MSQVFVTKWDERFRNNVASDLLISGTKGITISDDSRYTGSSNLGVMFYIDAITLVGDCIVKGATTLTVAELGLRAGDKTLITINSGGTWYKNQEKQSTTLTKDWTVAGDIKVGQTNNPEFTISHLVFIDSIITQKEVDFIHTHGGIIAETLHEPIKGHWTCQIAYDDGVNNVTPDVVSQYNKTILLIDNHGILTNYTDTELGIPDSGSQTVIKDFYCKSIYNNNFANISRPGDMLYRDDYLSPIVVDDSDITVCFKVFLRDAIQLGQNSFFELVSSSPSIIVVCQFNTDTSAEIVLSLLGYSLSTSIPISDFVDKIPINVIFQRYLDGSDYKFNLLINNKFVIKDAIFNSTFLDVSLRNSVLLRTSNLMGGLLYRYHIFLRKLSGSELDQIFQCDANLGGSNVAEEVIFNSDAPTGSSGLTYDLSGSSFQLQGGDSLIPPRIKALPISTSQDITFGNVGNIKGLTFMIQTATDNIELFELISGDANSKISIVAGVLTFGSSFSGNISFANGFEQTNADIGKQINGNSWNVVSLFFDIFNATNLITKFTDGSHLASVLCYSEMPVEYKLKSNDVNNNILYNDPSINDQIDIAFGWNFNNDAFSGNIDFDTDIGTLTGSANGYTDLATLQGLLVEINSLR